MADKKDYYLILGVPHDASIRGIRRAFCRLARDSHPDLDGPRGESAFHDAVEAYGVLSDPERRRRYDRSLLPPAAPEPGPATPAWGFAGRPSAVEPLDFGPHGATLRFRNSGRPAFGSRYDAPEPLIPDLGFATHPEAEPLRADDASGPANRRQGNDDVLRLFLRSLRLFL